MDSQVRDTLSQRPERPASINRRLGPTENIYCLLDKLYCLNFVAFAEIGGAPLDVGRIDLALQAVQAEHPLLRARVAVVNGRQWFKAAPLEQHPLRAETLPLRAWRAKLVEQLGLPFAGSAPLARFFWFRGSGRRSVAAMVFHHAIADGRSGADVFIEVLRRAGGEALPLRYRCVRASAHDLDLIKGEGLLRGSIKKLAYWLNQGKNALKFAQQLPGYDMAVRSRRNVKAIALSVPKTTAQALLAACRAHGTTAQGALGAAQILAINDEFGAAAARTLALTSLADLRGVLSGELTEQDLGLYIATVTTVHTVAAEPDFWQLAVDLRNQLKEILNSGEANLVHSIYREDALYPPNEIGARMVQALVGLAPASSMLTNVGRFDRLVLANGARVISLAFLISPPAQHPICVTAASYADDMLLNLLYDEHKMTAVQAQRIAKSMIAYIDAAAAG